MDGFAGAIGVSDSDGKSSPVVHTYRANASMDARYIAYALRTMALNGYVSTLAKGIRERSTAFDASTLADVLLPAPALDEQRRIADFLDVETTRMSQIEGLVRKAGQLASARRTAVIDAELGALSRDCVAPVTSACELVLDCVNKTAPIEVGETPYRMLRTSNVRDGQVSLDDTYRVSEETFKKWNRRGAPQVGDVLFTRQAPVGEAGLLTSDAPVFLGQQVMLYRPNPLRAIPEFLLFNFLSSFMKRQFELASDGAAHSHMRVHDCLKLRIYYPNLDKQRRIVDRVSRALDHADRLRAATAKQADLLAERRQALITAAVTGQFDVSIASGRNVTDGVSA
ncbi:restriction endonuclease subunit S [Streptomyces sp. YPW6]|uniref:restriction endonuclease subunit S n=1 Tax=Streptomyces sp. YPW6 TaxID=2840373 RepID=UPI001C0B8DFA|nr:restriction endonuclease subunit S [Streptomyces sp. YPW6]QWQ42991.1 restriction endonuclease subunit S [Streptomyces sp. YPW6]